MTNLTIFSKEIRTLDGLYSLNDLHKASGFKRNHAPFRFMRNDQTQELITEIERSPNLVIATKVIKGGHKDQGTWVCKELVYAYAMWISAKFHLQVIRAFDAMANQANALPVQSALSDNTHLKQMLYYVDMLQEKESQTINRIEKLQKRYLAMHQAMSEVAEELAEVKKAHSVNMDVVRHIHLHQTFSGV